MAVRIPMFAGSFYPSEKGELTTTVQELLNQAKDQELPGIIKGLIVPHAGFDYSGPIAATAYKLLSKTQLIENTILLGPSHSTYFYSAALDNNESWESPLGIVPCIKITQPEKPLIVLPEAHASEHCLEVQLPFLQYIYSHLDKPLSILPIVTGEVNPKDLAHNLNFLLQNPSQTDSQIADKFARQAKFVRVESKNSLPLLIVSSDLSHYYPYEEAKRKDEITAQAILELDTEKLAKKGEACGLIPILTIMQIAKEHKWEVKLLDLRNSGDTAGDKNRVVGYGAFAFF